LSYDPMVVQTGFEPVASRVSGARSSN